MSRDKKQLTVHISAVHEKKKILLNVNCVIEDLSLEVNQIIIGKKNMEMKDHISANFVTKNSKEMVL